MNQTDLKVVIVGGGFAGLNLVMQLKNKPGIDIVLADINNYNFFPPLLYQVATGFLEPSSISYPFRKFLRGKDNVRFRMGTLEKIIPAENKIILSNGVLDYDMLVLATGAETNYFGMENVKKYAIPMKTLGDALAMRNILLNRLEKAARTEDINEKRKLLTIVVAGGGPTGVEISGMFAEMRGYILRKDYPELSNLGVGRVLLVDGGPVLLAPMSKKSQEYTQSSLEKMGVQVQLNTTVKDYNGEVVYLSDGSTIESATLIWAAGVGAKVFDGIPAESYGRGKRLMVDAYNKVQGTTNMYAIGDTCYQSTDPDFPNGHPQVAQVAIQQGRNLGKNLLRPVGEWKAFAYNDKGAMAIIGRNKAVADIPQPKLHFNGFIAWLAWLFVHVMSLLNFRNRLKTIYSWVGAYISKDQSYRMIIREQRSE